MLLDLDLDILFLEGLTGERVTAVPELLNELASHWASH